MPSAWMPDSTIVPYRVYWVIFLRPASPSFASRSRLGMTTVRSCRMIDAEMYGMMPSAKIDSRLRLPPENRSTMPRSVPWTWSKNCASAWPSIPGVGTCAPMRYATSSTAVMMTRRLSSGILKTFWKLWRLSITKPAPARGASRLDRPSPRSSRARTRSPRARARSARARRRRRRAPCRARGRRPCRHPNAPCGPCGPSWRSCRDPSPDRVRSSSAAWWRPVRCAARQASRVTLSTWVTLAIMPRTDAESSWLTDWRIRRSPSARTVASCLGDRPIIDLVRVTLSFLSGTGHLLRGGGGAVAASPRRVQILESLDPPERVDGRLEHVVRVVRAERLREDVLDARGLEDRPHRAAGDDSGARHRRLQEDAAGAEVPGDLAGDRRLLQRHEDEVLLGVLDGLTDRLGHLVGLAETDAHVTAPVTDHDQRREREPSAALDDLGDAVDGDDAIVQLEHTRIDLRFRHSDSPFGEGGSAPLSTPPRTRGAWGRAPLSTPLRTRVR